MADWKIQWLMRLVLLCTWPIIGAILLLFCVVLVVVAWVAIPFATFSRNADGSWRTQWSPKHSPDAGGEAP